MFKATFILLMKNSDILKELLGRNM